MLSIALLGLACAPSDFGFTVFTSDDLPALEGQGTPTSPEPDITTGDAAALMGDLGLSTPSGVDELGPASPRIGMAWMRGTIGDDQPSALTALSDGSVVVAGAVGRTLGPSRDRGIEVSRVLPSGVVAWTSVLAPVADGLRINDLLPTADGGVWVCGIADPGTSLHPDIGDIPEDWGRTLLVMALDADGVVHTPRFMGGPGTDHIAAGCGLDGSGNLVIDGTIDGDSPQVKYPVGRMLLPTMEDQGFVLGLDSTGAPLRWTSWDASSSTRLASAVRPDGSTVQAIAYRDVPQLTVDTMVLEACPADAVCVGLLDFDPSGALTWLGSMGPDVSRRLTVAATSAGEVTIAVELGDDGVLPRRGGPAVAVSRYGTLIAQYSREMYLDWVSMVGMDATVTSLSSSGSGETWVALRSGPVDEVALGDERINLSHEDGTMAIGRLDDSGNADWLWAAQGPGVSRPVALAAVPGGVFVAATVLGDIALDQGGSSMRWLVSRDDANGRATNDLAVFLALPRE